MIQWPQCFRGPIVFCWVLTLTASAIAEVPLATGSIARPEASAASPGVSLPLPVEGAGSSPAIAPIRGFNLSLNSTSQHSSVTGWSNILTPDLSFGFNRHFFMDASLPWFLYDKAYVPVPDKSVTTFPLEQANNVIGDTTISGTYDLASGGFGYSAVAIVGFPTGNSLDGLGAGSTTYNITNHFEYGMGSFTPDVEFGEGNSSSLVNHNVKKAYTAVGPLANFQAGSLIDLPWKLSLDLEAYEALPIGDQKVYGTVTRKKKGKTTTRTTLESNGVAEDNGFTSELDIPIAPHFVLSGAYDRSLRQHDDIANISITYVFRIPRKSRD